MTRTLRAFAISALAALSLSVAACGGSDTPSAATTPAVSVSTEVSTAETTAPSPASAKVSANNASADELTAAFEAAGVSSADRWAREVEEYRPYPTDDATFAKLRDNLAKYNPSPDVVTKIIGALSLD
jgi:hypothetical protein